MKNRLLSTLLVALLATATFAQEKAKEKVSFKFYGFVRNYACYDTRASYTSNSEQFYYMPKDVNYNEDKTEDLNAQDNIMLLSITTRLGLNVTGLEFLGAKTSAKIESDFAGFGSSNTVLRIRQAYAKMEWEKSKLLVGQAWHPIMGDMMPDVFSLETGAPFTPFSRSPQVRYDFQTKGVTLTATALYQFQYTSYGPDGASFEYARNAIVPEFYLQGMIRNGGFMMGVGLDILTLKPRQYYTSTEKEFVKNPIYKADGTPVLDANGEQVYESVPTGNEVTVKHNSGKMFVSFTPTLFASYKKGDWGVKGRVTYAQNAAHLSMISGYGVTEKLDNGEWKYSSLNSISGWIDATYKLNLKKGFFTFCCFAGYTKNLGCMNDICKNDKGEFMLYMRGEKNMDYMWRVAPSVLYTHNALSVGVEYNPTTVGYSKNNGTDIKDNYTMYNPHAVTNHRICAMLRYNF